MLQSGIKKIRAFIWLTKDHQVQSRGQGEKGVLGLLVFNPAWVKFILSSHVS